MALVGKKAPLFSEGAVINGEEIVDGFSLVAVFRQATCGVLLLSFRFHFCVPYRNFSFSGEIG
jgi:peroxiredoxin 2/4